MLSSLITPDYIPSSIADNFCKQLESFQNAIFARPVAEQIPTIQEINMQTKLLTNIIKIKKFNATDQLAKFMNTFCRFLGKEDKEQAKTIAGKFMDFMRMGTSTAAVEPAIQPTKQPIPQPAPIPHDALKEEAYSYTYSHFEQYKHLLEDYKYGNKDTIIDIGEKQYNKQCVEYNLLQCTLPEASQRFILDPGEYHRLIDHEQTIKQIERYLRKGMR